MIRVVNRRRRPDEAPAGSMPCSLRLWSRCPRPSSPVLPGRNRREPPGCSPTHRSGSCPTPPRPPLAHRTAPAGSGAVSRSMPPPSPTSSSPIRTECRRRGPWCRRAEQLVATVSDGTGLTRTIPLQAPAQFARPTFTAVGTLNMADVAATAVSLTQGTGASGTGTVTVSIAPSVKAAGRLAGHRLQLQFDRPVVFSYTAGPAAGAATLSPSTLSDGSSAPGSLTSGGAPAPLVVASGGSLLVPRRQVGHLLPGDPRRGRPFRLPAGAGGIPGCRIGPGAAAPA